VTNDRYWNKEYGVRFFYRVEGDITYVWVESGEVSHHPYQKGGQFTMPTRVFYAWKHGAACVEIQNKA